MSDAQAKLSRSLASDDNRPLLSGQDGWIWIGTYTPGSPRWEKPKIRPNTADYFLEQPSVGAIRRDTRVQALGQPQAVQRPYARQYWMKVHVVP